MKNAMTPVYYRSFSEKCKNKTLQIH